MSILPEIITLNEAPASGPLRGTTNNFQLRLINYNWVTWHTYEHQNWVDVDALLSAALLSVGLEGQWAANIDYDIGATVIITQTTSVQYGNIMRCITAHTSQTQFDNDFGLGYWEALSVGDFVQSEGDTMTGPLVLDNTYIDVSAGAGVGTRITGNLIEFGADGGTITTDGSPLEITAPIVISDTDIHFRNAGNTVTEGRLYRDGPSKTLVVACYDEIGANGLFYRFDNASTLLGNSTSVLRRTDGDSRYLQLAGGLMTGVISTSADIELKGSARMEFRTADNTALNGILYRDAGSSTLALLCYDNAGANSQAYRFDNANTLLGGSTSVLRRADGDGRYLQLAGGSVTGNINLLGTGLLNFWNAGQTVKEGTVYHSDAQEAVYIAAWDNAGANGLYYKFDNSTGIMSANESVVRKLDGDNRYLQLTGGTLTGDLGVGTSNPVVGVGNSDLGIYVNTRYIAASRSGAAALFINRATSNGPIQQFYRDGTQEGSISVTTTATSYNTTSDERLKTNFAEAGDAGAILDQIDVLAFDRIENGEHFPFGFVAQQLYETFPEAVTPGGEDPTTDPWQVDNSKLVPVLVKEIQSLRARVAVIEGNAV